MRPAISGRIITPSSARREPTAPVSMTAGAILAGTARTGIDGGAFGWASDQTGGNISSR